MKRLALLFSIFICFTVLTAQTDTTYFNSGWEQCDKASASYYRLPMIASGEGYLIRDFYISGAKQFEGISLNQDSDVYQGTTTWFYENGRPEQVAHYENGLKQGEYTYYDKDGKQLSKGTYKDDSPYDGSFYQSSVYYTQVLNYSEGELKTAEAFDPTSKSKARVSTVVTDNVSMNGEITYYNQKGEPMGKLLVQDNAPYSGIIVDFTYMPMSVSSVYKLSEGTFESPIKYYYSNGSLKKLLYFDSDINYSTKEVYYDADGKLIDSLILSDGTPQDGIKIDFFSAYESASADKVEKISQYSSGQLNGQTKTYFLNGKINTLTNYSEGYITGNQITYDSLGNVLYTLNYQEGTPWEGTLQDETGYKKYSGGNLIEEKQFYPDGKTMLVLADNVETVFDTLGNEIARLQYKDGEPYEGKNLTIYYNQIYSEEIYSQGIKTRANYYTDGKVSQSSEYNSDGNQTKDSYFYTTGKVQKEVYYKPDGSESSEVYYNTEGKQMGKLTMGEWGTSSGDKFEFDGDQILTHYLYKDDIVQRTWFYQKGELVYDILHDGKSTFYDRTNNKTYTCVYKDGQPYSGTKFEWDSDYSGITELSSYKDGQLDGESTEYTYAYSDDSYTTGVLIPEFVYNYKSGVKEGSGKQYFQGKLIRSMNYSNDMLEGEYKSFDMDGNLLATTIYKEDYPYEGTVCDYDYSYSQVISLNNYTEGNLNGEQKYYSNGALNRVETFDQGTILKEVSYLMGFEYMLTYENSLPFEGKKIDPYYYSISEYHEGNPVSVKTYTGDDYTSLSSIETFQDGKSTKVSFYPNGQKKEEGEYENYQRSGKTTFYTSDGKVIASGVFETDVPVSGSCVFYSTENETDYLIMQIDNTNFKVTEYIDGKPGRVHQYSNPDIDSNSMVEEVQKFSTIVQSIFENYSYPYYSEW